MGQSERPGQSPQPQPRSLESLVSEISEAQGWPKPELETLSGLDRADIGAIAEILEAEVRKNLERSMVETERESVIRKSVYARALRDFRVKLVEVHKQLSEAERSE